MLWDQCPAMKPFFFERNTRKKKKHFLRKTKLEKKEQRKMKNMKAKSPSNGLLLTPLSTEAKKSKFSKENRLFYRRNFWAGTF